MSGSQEIVGNIKIYINDIEPQALKRGITSACALVSNTAKRICPHDTGALMRSISFAVEDTGKEGVVYSNLEYAPYVEIGTGIYSSRGDGRQTPWRFEGRKGWATTRGQRPQPFLERALELNTNRIAQLFEGLV